MNSIERARKSSAEMSLALEGPRNGGKPPKLPNAALVDDVCDYLGDCVLSKLRRHRERVAPEHQDAFKLDVIKVNDGDFTRLAVTRDDFRRVIAASKEALANSMLQWPQQEHEELEDYCERLRQNGDDMHRRRMYVIGQVMAHLLRMEREEREAHRRAEAERKASVERRKREERAELERNPLPSRDEIKRLLSRIESASNGEKLLANISAAIEAHRQAEAARKELTRIFDAERDACASLGKRAPSRPDVPAAPPGASRLSDSEVAASIALHRPAPIFPTSEALAKIEESKRGRGGPRQG